MESIVNEHIDRIRRFNRFYTRQIGVIDGHYLDTPFSLTEARVIYEIANNLEPTASLICELLGLDAGYLSRIVQRLHRDGLVDRQVSHRDNRQSILSLTENGKAAFATLNERSHVGIQELLKPLSPVEQTRLVKAMQTVETLLSPSNTDSNRAPILIRPPHSGDMGWVVKRHGELYTQEYGWNMEFEGLVAEIVANFVKNFDEKYERCWIAEQDGENVGCIFLVKLDEETAKLRMLLVDPKTRGMGLGGKLVDECIRFARQCGYRKMVLWTNSILYSAIHLYEKAGFHKVNEEPQHSYGKDLVFENWEMDL